MKPTKDENRLLWLCLSFVTMIATGLIIQTLGGCAFVEGVRQSNKSDQRAKLSCDPQKVVEDWPQWDAEVRAILCREANICGDPDEGAGYGYTVGLFHAGYTPCSAAKAVLSVRNK